MTETELDNWRRTHYSNELISSTNEMDVIVMGWISSVRGHGNISFVTIEDMTGQIQIVSKICRIIPFRYSLKFSKTIFTGHSPSKSLVI